VSELTVTQIAIAAAALVTLAGYAAFILRPAWASYGRTWEKLAASFLTLFILATLVGLGAALGLAIFWAYIELA
jgi:hypothetical protein